ncbi:uncharacterized protein LOC128962344 [Oppia nitens]|uniref:uncharacterized protein LOC128962344 n=1 Tax=Oppia nitens TaxID=1686743 RepID=UPI0023DAAA3F|nr:uncharacterized protein LOC128962344 [Oppia nitens]
MYTTNNIALTLMALSVCLPFAYSLNCWDCNSLINANCNDPFKEDDFAMADCNQKFLPHFPNQPGTICRKIVQKVNDEYRTIRGCGYLNDLGQEIKPGTVLPNDCIKRAGTFSVLVQYCSCNGKDGCNHSTHLIVSSITLIIPIALILSYIL